MPQITLRVGEPLRHTLGARRLTLILPEGATLADLLDHLTAAYPAFGPAFRGEDLGRDHPYLVFVNHRPVTAPNYETTPLHDHDTVHILLPVVGGDHA